MIQGIVYVSKTGATKAYATMLGERLNLPVYELGEAKEIKGKPVLYFGWIMASKIVGYQKAKKMFDVRAVIGVGIEPSGTRLDKLRSATKVDESIPVMALQGWLKLEELHGLSHLMMKMLSKKVGDDLETKNPRTADEESILQVMRYHKNPVCMEQLNEVVSWYESIK